MYLERNDLAAVYSIRSFSIEPDRQERFERTLNASLQRCRDFPSRLRIALLVRPHVVMRMTRGRRDESPASLSLTQIQPN